MGLYRKAKPDELRGATVLKDAPMRPITTLADVIVSADDPRLTVNTPAAVNTPKKARRNPPAGQPTPAGVLKADRHKPGYMAEYMRKRRAAK